MFVTLKNKHPWISGLDIHTGICSLKRVARELGENLTDEEIQEMIDEADRDGEFVRAKKEKSL